MTLRGRIRVRRFMLPKEKKKKRSSLLGPTNTKQRSEYQAITCFPETCSFSFYMLLTLLLSTSIVFVTTFETDGIPFLHFTNSPLSKSHELHHSRIPSFRRASIHLKASKSSKIKDTSIGKETNVHQTNGAPGEASPLCIKFSHSFQRYVVYRPKWGKNGCNNEDDCLEVIASYPFLDEAMELHPEAELAPISQDVAGEDASILLNRKNVTFNERTNEKSGYETLLFLSSIASNPNQRNRNQQTMAVYLAERMDKKRFLFHTPETIRRNYGRILDLLTRGRKQMGAIVREIDENEKMIVTWANNAGLGLEEKEAREVIQNFPQICLYNYHELEERVRFLLAPPPPILAQEKEHFLLNDKKHHDIDWPSLSHKNYGAGLTIQQATETISAIPQLLSMYHEDARKASILYFYQQLHVSYKECDEARIELPSLIGCDAADVCCFAYVHSRGVSWDSIRIMMDAFPTITFCDLHVGWEVEGPSRNVMKESMLTYLRKRLQIGPKEVFAMIKTHSRVSGYEVEGKIKPTLEAIQSSLCLSSSELRQIILRMPSLMGMNAVSAKDSLSSLDKRLDFFFNEVSMSQTQLKEAVLKQPSLLQYNVESTLRPKMRFLVEDLEISPSSISRIIHISPSIMGLSLSQNLRPTCSVIMERCNFSHRTLGEIITISPPILTLSLKKKIEPCLSFLESALFITSNEELGQIIYETPRLLVHSVHSSLAPKLMSIQDAIERERSIFSKNNSNAFIPSAELAAALVRRNPSLLVTTNGILKNRLEKELERGMDCSLWYALKPRVRRRKLQFLSNSEGTNSSSLSTSTSDSMIELQRLKKTRRAVLELCPDTDEIIDEFMNVKNAAEVLRVSESLVYAACNKGRTAKGKKLVYAVENREGKPLRKKTNTINLKREISLLTTDDVPTALDRFDTKTKILIWKPLHLFYDVIENNNKLRTPTSSPKSVSIVAFVSGSVFPADDIKTVRGTRKAGGLAVHFPQVQQGLAEQQLPRKLQVAADSCFGVGIVLPEIEGGSDFTNGRISVGFPFLRTSRHRCDLYACHAALKVSLQLLKQAAALNSMEDVDVNIDICTDSEYAWNLLRNVERVSCWGKISNIDDFVFDGEGPSSLANPDLLYPLSKTFNRLVNKTAKDSLGRSLCLAKNVNIKFLHSGEMLNCQDDHNCINQMGEFAKIAAMWQYNRTKMF